MTKEESFFLGQIEDRIDRCRDKSIPTHTGFLDSHQQSLARQFCRQQQVPVRTPAQETALADAGYADDLPAQRTVFYGGYADAERVVMLNLPAYATLAEADPLTVIRAETPASGRTLTHRDYLGSLLAVGIRRELVGDILVRPQGADILVLEEIADFLLLHYGKAGRTTLTLSRQPVRALQVPPQTVTTRTDTVASLRLDSVVASAFGLARSKAVQAIAAGLVFVNDVETTKPDAVPAEGDRITLRGTGRACLLEVGDRSRKGRIRLTIQRYGR